MRHRADIQGMRAVAVLLVALSHAGVGALSGGFVGVDVFFVLSGFLITSLLLAEARRRRFVSLADFYLRRARRILPAAILTLLVTDYAAYRLLNAVRARQALQDSLASLLFGANIHFAAIGTDYFAQGQPPSPFQHFWSLSVEEQFYVVWPTLFILLLGLSFRRYARRPERIRRRAWRRLAIALGSLALLSLAWSIRDTAASPASAYFSTPARVWELALGAGLAVAAPVIGPRMERWRAVAGWAGLGLIAVAAVAFSASTPFPGVAALVPTLGAALVIAAGSSPTAGRRGDAASLLALGPLGYIGDRSYAFYLWHWPVLVIASQHAGHDLSVPTNLLLLLAAFGISVVSYRFVERPMRNARLTRRPQIAYAWATATVFAAAIVVNWTSAIDSHEAQLVAAAEIAPLPVLSAAPAASAAVPVVAVPGATPAAGAQALPAVVHEVQLEAHHPPMPAVLIPAASQLLSDLPSLPPGCIASASQASSSICHLGTPSRRIIIAFGDSHAEMWLPDLVAVAEGDGMTVVPLLKAGCSPNDWLVPSGSCSAWFRWALREAEWLHSVVTVVGGHYSSIAPELDPTVIPALDAVVRALRPHTGRVVLMGDIPYRTQQPVDCLLAAHATPAGCAELQNENEVGQTVQVRELTQGDRVGFIDPTGWFCAEQECPLVVGNLITYRDIGHAASTYLWALRDVFRAAFEAAAR